jgi:iron complex outermembrane recepter protein
MSSRFLRAAVSAHVLIIAAALSPTAFADPVDQAPVGSAEADAAGPEAEPAKQTVIVVGQTDAPITVVPRGLSVSLGEEQFDAINAVNVEDLMKYAPNFFIRKRYIGDANGVPGFRGTHSSQSARTLAMVDGFVISNFLGNSFGFPPKWGVVGPGEVEQFDIVYGPYSSRYTGNSMGGVISITTKEPQNDEAFVTAQTFVQPYKWYGTDDTYEGYTLEAGAGWRPGNGPFALRASYRHFENTGQPMSWYQFNASTATSGTPVTGAVVDPGLVVQAPVFASESPDDNTQDQFRLRGDLDVGDWKLQALGVVWTTDSDRTHPQIYIHDAAGNPVTSGVVAFGGQQWTPAAVPLATTERVEALTGFKAAGPLLGWDARVNLSHFWEGKDESKQSNTYDGGLANGAGKLTRQNDPNWTTLDATFERTFGAHAVAFGFTANQYETETEVFSTANWRAATNQDRTNLTGGKSRLIGAFVEDEIAINDAVSITAGARVDQWKAFDGQVGAKTTTPVAGFAVQTFPDRTETDVNGSLSGTWNFAEDWTAQLSLATATRYPTVGELFQGTLLSDGTFNLNSFDPNLKPEKSKDANLMLRRRLDAFGGEVNLTGSLFYQDISDALFRQQGFNQFGIVVTSNQNIDEVRQIGLEAIAESKDAFLDGLDIDLNVAFIDAEIVSNPALVASEGKQFPRIPYWRANGNVRYAITPKLKASLGFRMNTETSNNLEGTQKGDTYGYASKAFVVDTRLSWMATDHAEISFGIDNLNNDKAWAFHPFPQRTFVVEAKWRQ